jgi:hypothetical protein
VGKNQKSGAQPDAGITSPWSLSSEEKTLLLDALGDTKPTVVEASIRKIGELRATEFEKRLIAMYRDVEKRFRGAYAERLKAGIITAVGKCNGSRAMPFIDSLLIYNKRCQYTRTILHAARATDNPSLLSSVKVFRKRLEMECARMDAAGVEPLLTSELKTTIRLAQDVETSLSDNNGGRK